MTQVGRSPEGFEGYRNCLPFEALTPLAPLSPGGREGNKAKKENPLALFFRLSGFGGHAAPISWRLRLVHVPQRPQPLDVLRIDLRRSEPVRDDESLLHAVEPVAEVLRDFRARGGGAGFARIAEEVEEPWPVIGETEDLLALADHHADFQQTLAPRARRLLRGEHRSLVGLEEGDAVARRRGPLEHRGPVETMEPGRARQSGQPEDGGRHVDVEGRRVDDGAGPDPAAPGEAEGDAQRRLEEVAAVSPITVLAQALAMIGGEDEEGVGLESRIALKGLQQAAQVMVHERDLGVVTVLAGDLATHGD